MCDTLLISSSVQCHRSPIVSRLRPEEAGACVHARSDFPGPIVPHASADCSNAASILYLAASQIIDVFAAFRNRTPIPIRVARGSVSLRRKYRFAKRKLSGFRRGPDSFAQMPNRTRFDSYPTHPLNPGRQSSCHSGSHCFPSLFFFSF